jgi:hypothetical protein
LCSVHSNITWIRLPFAFFAIAIIFYRLATGSILF